MQGILVGCLAMRGILLRCSLSLALLLPTFFQGYRVTITKTSKNERASSFNPI